MGRKGFQQASERDQVVGLGTGFVELVDVFHQRCHGGIETVAMEVGGDFLDGLMAGGEASGVVGGERLSGFGWVKAERPAAIQEAINPTDSFSVPSGILIVRTDEHFVGTEGVGAIAAINYFQRVDHIPLGLGHFLAVGSVDVAVVEELFDGFTEGQVALVSEELAPEADVEQVCHGVIAADVNVQR